MLTQTVITYSRMFLSKTDRTALRIFLESSPQYPSLLSVVQTLRYVGIKVSAGQCGWDYLQNLSSPFLLHLKLKAKDTLVIARKKPVGADNPTVDLEVYNPRKNRWETKTENDFSDTWDGVVIYTDALPLNRRSMPERVKVALVSTTALLLLSLAMYVATGISVLDGLPLTIGILVSGTAYLRQYLPPIATVEKLCHISPATDCRKVEESSFSSILGVKMSTLAFSFFLAQYVTILLAGCFGLSDLLSTAYLMALLMVIPAGLYSAYSQIGVSKACPLCIIILVCMAAEAAYFLGMTEKAISSYVFILWCSVAAIIASYLHLISVWEKTRRRELATRILAQRLKRKKTVMLAESVPIGLFDSPLWLGEENSSVALTSIISPGCPHCREVADRLLSLIEKGDRFRWNIILGRRGKHDDELMDNWIIRYLSDRNQFIKDLSAWSRNGKEFPDCKLESVSEKTPAAEISRLFSERLALLKITGFPKIIRDDRLLSPAYTADDLEFLIADQLQTMK